MARTVFFPCLLPRARKLSGGVLLKFAPLFVRKR